MMNAGKDEEEGSFKDEPNSTINGSDANADTDANGPTSPPVGPDPTAKYRGVESSGRCSRRTVGFVVFAAIAIIVVAVTVPTVRNRNRSSSADDSATSASGGGAAAADPTNPERTSSGDPTDPPVTSAPTPAPTFDLRETCTVAAEAESASSVACTATTATSATASSIPDRSEDIFHSRENATTERDSDNRWMKLGPQVEGESAGDVSGMAISMSCDGSVLAIGAQLNDGAEEGLNETQREEVNSNVGHVRVFALMTNSSSGDAQWQQLGQDIDGEADSDWSGGAVSLSSSGTRVAIGARFNDGFAKSSGHVRVFDYRSGAGEQQSGDWVQVGVDLDGTAETDNLGRAVSLSADGRRLAVGASGADSPTTPGEENVGRVQVLELDSELAWIPLGQEVYGERANDYFGRSVALSPDGSTLVVGGYRNDNRGNGGEEQSSSKDDIGHARVFQYDADEGLWTQLGQDLPGTKAGDWFGMAVHTSYDGGRVVVGAPGDNNRFLPGYAQVYDLIDGNWTKVGGDLEGGYSVALSFDGTRVAVGSYKGFNNGINSGHVKVYEMDANSTWTIVGGDINGENRNMFGTSIALSANGMRVASGAPAHVGPNGEVEMGTVRVFNWCN